MCRNNNQLSIQEVQIAFTTCVAFYLHVYNIFIHIPVIFIFISYICILYILYIYIYINGYISSILWQLRGALTCDALQRNEHWYYCYACMFVAIISGWFMRITATLLTITITDHTSQMLTWPILEIQILTTGIIINPSSVYFVQLIMPVGSNFNWNQLFLSSLRLAPILFFFYNYEKLFKLLRICCSLWLISKEKDDDDEKRKCLIDFVCYRDWPQRHLAGDSGRSCPNTLLPITNGGFVVRWLYGHSAIHFVVFLLSFLFFFCVYF